MTEELNINELIKIESLPKIFSQLEDIGSWIDAGLAELDLNNLPIDEEHKQDLKKSRAEINKISDALETKRKEIKSKILEPYEKFEEKYDIEVRNKLKNAEQTLSNAIAEIEIKQKQEKENNLRQFFDNYNQDYHFENVFSFEDVGLNITLSASETALKKQIVDFFDKVYNDFMAIQNGENAQDVLYEYQHNGFDYVKALNSVNAKLKEIKELEEKLAKKDEIEQVEQNVVQNVETLVSAPVEVVEEETIECEFKVYATKSQLKELKAYLQEKGIKYE
jgi:hypothetical protein